MTATMTKQEKFSLLKSTLDSELLERSAIIETQILALLSRTHHFQIGEPGVGKSLSIRRLLAHIGGLDDNHLYETLMTRFSSPEEVFGPLDLQALKQSRYKFMIDGYAPAAKVWFLDEIWKSNASILNAMLMALNERRFRNDGAVGALPLWSMFCASNEMPEGEELNALYDRIHFRHIVRRIQEQGNFILMVKNTIWSDEEILTWQEIEDAAAEVDNVYIPDDVWDALNTVRNDLKNQGIEPTDRRFHECAKIIRAKAWLEGEEVADLQHMHPLGHVLWTTPNEQPVVLTMMLELSNPLDKDAGKLMEVVESLAAEMDKVMGDSTLDPTVKNKKGVELHGKVQRAKKDLKKLRQQINESGRKSQLIDDVQSRLIDVAKRLLSDVFVIDEDTMNTMEQ